MRSKIKPRYLSPEHAAQVARFQGYPYDAEESARLRAWAEFKKWEHDQYIARDRLLLSAGRTGKRD